MSSRDSRIALAGADLNKHLAMHGEVNKTEKRNLAAGFAENRGFATELADADKRPAVIDEVIETSKRQ